MSTTPSTSLFRDEIRRRLVEDLVGPLRPDEVLADRPTQRYSTGILYPQGSRMRPEENEDGGAAVNESEDAASMPEEAGASLHAALKPSVAGLSFAVKRRGEDTPTMRIEVSCAIYRRFRVDEEGNEIEGEPTRRSERWRRIPLLAACQTDLGDRETRLALSGLGIPGMELYVLAVPIAGLITVTVAASNLLQRGDSLAFDEEQHFFQVELSITGIGNGSFAPRPSRKAQTDDDSRIAALIYRDVKEYVVGHTCSGRAILDGEEVSKLRTDWVPTVRVRNTSDRGAKVFDGLRGSGKESPLSAEHLSTVEPGALCAGLTALVDAYTSWIDGEEARLPTLPADLQPQGRRHLDRCRVGARRMMEGIAEIRRNADVRDAFQIAQNAMSRQFEWLQGKTLQWRPFQLAFQLLVLASLARRDHEDRQKMDLLWFPTGGGKTEAYLALTSFVIALRRLRGSEHDDGGGVAVLMRYTLRLLTVQQFQRAAAMILATELLRRRSATGRGAGPRLGSTPIGIGLWVGAGATPLTLRDALSKGDGDTSTPRQITVCPCCGEELSWSLTPKRSTVECKSHPTICELAASGSELPIWTIDEEVYRYAPSLVIGTIDKFAQIVRKLETRAIFGRDSGRHPPDLIVQDELHLISGPLGSIAGLYEVAIDELCRQGSHRAKIVGSTATIRRAEDQILRLFDRDTYQFPAPGLDAGNSGFAVTDDESPGRLYVGVSTAGRSATYMLQALVASLLQSASDPAVAADERDWYWTLVTYFNSLRELGRALVLMQDDVPVSIEQFAARRGEGKRRVEAPAELTSRVPQHEIRDMLDRLKSAAPDPEAVDLLLASNMISVGMDISRLGLMVVNAQPKTLSEYIQATSRVGRGSVPGLVVTMYNAMRARDRSHFETFETWHRCLYRDVEATSVTPFASRAQDKALHAVLVALVRHTVPGMDRRPVLDDLRRSDAERIAGLIEGRVARVDAPERAIVAQKLKGLIDQWCGRPDLQTYWDDFSRKTSLLMSAEQFAARADVDPDLDAEGARRALWSTPNSMREVEAGAPFILRPVLRAEGN